MEAKAPQVIIESLPLELLQGILAACSILDFQTLQSPALSGPLLYHAFKTGQMHIVKLFLRHHVGEELWFDVVAAFPETWKSPG